MARRAAEIDHQRKENQDVVVLDCGDMFFKNTSQTDLRAKTIFSLMKKMKLDAINVGEGELSFGPAFFLEHATSSGIPFVSANVELKDDTSGIIKKFVMVKKHGITICVTGVIAPTYLPRDAEEKGIKVKDTVGALQEVLNAARGKADVMILLSHLEYSVTKEFLQLNELNGVDIVISGHGRNFTPEVEFINGVVLVQSSMGGEQLGKLSIDLKKPGQKEKYKIENIIMTEEYPEDPEILKILNMLKEREAAISEQFQRDKKNREDEKARREVLKMSPEEFLNSVGRNSSSQK